MTDLELVKYAEDHELTIIKHQEVEISTTIDPDASDYTPDPDLNDSVVNMDPEVIDSLAPAEFYIYRDSDDANDDPIAICKSVDSLRYYLKNKFNLE